MRKYIEVSRDSLTSLLLDIDNEERRARFARENLEEARLVLNGTIDCEPETELGLQVRQMMAKHAADMEQLRCELEKNERERAEAVRLAHEARVNGLLRELEWLRALEVTAAEVKDKIFRVHVKLDAHRISRTEAATLLHGVYLELP